MRHAWVKEGAPSILDVCTTCGTKRCQVFVGDVFKSVRYLVSGVGWTEARPDFFIPSHEQKSLFD